MKKIFTSIGIAALILVWLGLTAGAWFGKPETMSVSERRQLAQKPELTIETLLAKDDYRADGTIRKKNSFMSLFEEYSLDQFPLRDRFRQVKSVFTYYVMQQKDNNEIYVEDGYAAKLLYPLDEAKLEANLKVLNTVVQQQIVRGKCKLYVAARAVSFMELILIRTLSQAPFTVAYRFTAATPKSLMAALVVCPTRTAVSSRASMAIFISSIGGFTQMSSASCIA